MTIAEKISAAKSHVVACVENALESSAHTHDPADHQNDAANLYAANYAEYLIILAALKV